MVFSSLIFLSVFLPIVLAIYPLLKNNGQIYFLLFTSLFFYWWGEPSHLWVMLLSVATTHYFALKVSQIQKKNWRITLAASGIFLNLSLLFYFKYASFFYNTIIRNISKTNGTSNTHIDIALPIGISFFVFQGISYIVDVYRNESPPQSNILKTGCYIAMFPQLIAGPIVRYNSIASQLANRDVSLAGYTEGLTRFCYGLAKKVLLANPAGEIADIAFGTPTQDLSMPMAWFGVFAYTMQIYFDFSGYSDMAIGLGRVLGFTFPENFNFPYIARSLTEFWRRWHISLSTWFKDYLYIPLGGNRKGSFRTNINLFVVFALTGFWHGASWTFLIWGLWHGAFLIIEKHIAKRTLLSPPKILSWFYCMLVVMLGWVLFRSESLTFALQYISAMFNPNKIYINLQLFSLLEPKTIVLFLVMLPISMGLGQSIKKYKHIYNPSALLLLVITYISLANSTYNPFIYFRF